MQKLEELKEHIEEILKANIEKIREDILKLKASPDHGIVKQAHYLNQLLNENWEKSINIIAYELKVNALFREMFFKYAKPELQRKLAYIEQNPETTFAQVAEGRLGIEPVKGYPLGSSQSETSTTREETLQDPFIVGDSSKLNEFRRKTDGSNLTVSIFENVKTIGYSSGGAKTLEETLIEGGECDDLSRVMFHELYGKREVAMLTFAVEAEKGIFGHAGIVVLENRGLWFYDPSFNHSEPVFLGKYEGKFEKGTIEEFLKKNDAAIVEKWDLWIRGTEQEERMGKIKEIREVRAWTEMNEVKGSYYSEKGLDALNSGDYILALTCYHLADSLGYSSNSMWRNYLYLYIELAKNEPTFLDDAVQLIERKKLGASKDPGVLLNVGLSYSQAKEYNKAYEYFKKAVELEPTMVAAYLDLTATAIEISKLLFAKANYAGAIKILTETVESTGSNLQKLDAQDPNFVLLQRNMKAIYCNISAAYINLGDKEAAKRYFLKSIAIHVHDEKIDETLKKIEKQLTE